MNSFKDLEKENLDEHVLPLGIKSNVQNHIGGMRTFGSIINVYLGRILETFTGLFGGDIMAESNTHMLTLFTPTRELTIEPKDFLATLNNTFELEYSPKVLWILPVERGIEISIKLPARDAKKIRRKIRSGKLDKMKLELRA